ncbi:MAG: Gfo/Idh/MocA family protein [Rhodospirillales bacterium]
MKPGNAIRLGIIGCGRVARERHLPALLRVPEFRVTATSDSDGERSRALAGRFKGARSFTDYRAVLELGDVDAVAILTPTMSHAEIGLAALDAGKHVFMEKPLAMNLEQCDRLIARAADSPCRIVVGFNLRWHRLVRCAREFLNTGSLGRIKAIRSVYTHNRTGVYAPDWHRELKLGGGVTLNEAVHHFDLWRYFTGSEVEQVHAWAAPSKHYEEETSVVAARMSGGVLATGVFSMGSAPNSEIEIFGENGRLCLSLYRFDGLEFFPFPVYPGDLADRFKKAVRALGDLREVLRLLARGGVFQATFEGIWRHFAGCVLHDLPSQCKLADGKKSLEAALATVCSERTGTPVSIGTSQSSYGYARN